MQQHMDANQTIKEFPFLIGHKNNIPCSKAMTSSMAKGLTVIENRYNVGFR
jgi:hypothetical protein